MHKKTIIGLAIATILIAYISALTSSNQAFAQPPPFPPAVPGGIDLSNPVSASSLNHVGQTLAGHEAQLGIQPINGLGTSPDHTKQFGITKPPKLTLKRVGCNPLDPRGC